MTSSSSAVLFRQHRARVYRQALRLLGNTADAEEATQEVFLRCLWTREALEDDHHELAWLLQVTTNYCLNTLRDRQRRRRILAAKLGSGTDSGQTRPAAGREDVIGVRQLLSSADERQAQAAVCVLMHGMSHSEAAEEIGVSPRTVRNLLTRFSSFASAELRRVRVAA